MINASYMSSCELIICPICESFTMVVGRKGRALIVNIAGDIAVELHVPPRLVIILFAFTLAHQC